MRVTVEFGGGLEGLVSGNKKRIAIEFSDSRIRCTDLIQRIGEEWIVERKELFYNPVSLQLKPGILVLINDCDWELQLGSDTLLQDNDVVSLISTLHGG